MKIDCNPSPGGYECELEEDHAGPCKAFDGDPDEESWWGSPRRDKDGRYVEHKWRWIEDEGDAVSCTCGMNFENLTLYHIYHDKTSNPAEGKKNDKGKPRMSLVHQPTLWGLIAVLEHGAAKYGAFNYRDVVDGRDRYYNAAHRHLAAWKQGEKLDKESGLKHLHHVIASLFFLSEMDIES